MRGWQVRVGEFAPLYAIARRRDYEYDPAIHTVTLHQKLTCLRAKVKLPPRPFHQKLICLRTLDFRALQGYLADKKQPPPPRTTIGP